VERRHDLKHDKELDRCGFTSSAAELEEDQYAAVAGLFAGSDHSRAFRGVKGAKRPPLNSIT
jgi:hypothetical protein